MNKLMDNIIDTDQLLPGNYVVAVSGGVDSVSLLDILVKAISEIDSKKRPKLIVAHYDHGIRPDSHYDRSLVQNLAKKHKLTFVYDEGKLGPGVSETEARRARYQFLEKTKQASNARAIITAHHADDAVETAVINFKRGTGRKGVSSLADHPHMQRPLLHLSKAELINYAKQQGLVWREDSTNRDSAILRNYIRLKLSQVKKHPNYPKLLASLKKIHQTNRELDGLIESFLHSQPARNVLDRHQFADLPFDVAVEVMAQWLRNQNITTFNSGSLQDLVIKCKTLPAGKVVDVDGNNIIDINPDNLALVARDR